MTDFTQNIYEGMSLLDSKLLSLQLLLTHSLIITTTIQESWGLFTWAGVSYYSSGYVLGQSQTCSKTGRLKSITTRLQFSNGTYSVQSALYDINRNRIAVSEIKTTAYTAGTYNVTVSFIDGPWLLNGIDYITVTTYSGPTTVGIYFTNVGTNYWLYLMGGPGTFPAVLPTPTVNWKYTINAITEDPELSLKVSRIVDQPFHILDLLSSTPREVIYLCTAHLSFGFNYVKTLYRRFQAYLIEKMNR